jgi:hypothetical protein
MSLANWGDTQLRLSDSSLHSGSPPDTPDRRMGLRARMEVAWVHDQGNQATRQMPWGPTGR